MDEVDAEAAAANRAADMKEEAALAAELEAAAADPEKFARYDLELHEVLADLTRVPMDAPDDECGWADDECGWASHPPDDGGALRCVRSRM